MNTRAVTTFLHFDIRLQWRRGLYLTYLVVIVFYTAALHQLPVQARQIATVVLLFIDSSMLGFFFLGALVQWERAEHLYEGLFTTPFPQAHFLFCRTVSLSLLTLIMSFLLVLLAVGPPVGPLQLAAGLLGGAAFFVLFGYPLALKTRNIIGYFLTATLYTLPLLLPVLDLFGLLRSKWFVLLPTGGMLELLRAGVTGADGSPLPALASLIVWNALMVFLALRLSRPKAAAC
jgi:fluoroquinolone transport system permease protein